MRSGEDGLKNGPSVCANVTSSPSWHAGVGFSGACAKLAPIPNSEPAAKAPAPSTLRRVGRSNMSFLHSCRPRPRPRHAYPVRTGSAHGFQLVDHPGDDRKSAVPEFGISCIQPERPQQFGIVLGAAGGEHVEITLGK